MFKMYVFVCVCFAGKVAVVLVVIHDSDDNIIEDA